MRDLVDIGANLTHASFQKDLDAVLERARAAGLVSIVVSGSDADDSRAAAALAARHPQLLHATAGVHPHHAGEAGKPSSMLAELREIARDPRVVAVGECGLDFNRNYSPHPDQEKCFVAQLELAAELKKPLFLHSRDAHPRFAEIIRAHRDALPRAVAHCFTGEKKELFAYLDLDLYIGITGWICDERRGRHLLELLRSIPPGRLMIETDAPYLTPRDMKPQPKERRNEPAFLPHILEAVARAAGRDAKQVASETTRTARAFFDLPERAAAAGS
jgi:TatD DNase family protein